MLVLLTLVPSGLFAAGASGEPAIRLTSQISPVTTPIPGATPHAATPAAATPVSPAGGATPVATPAATPVPELACEGPCLVRFGVSPALDAALITTGLRASYSNEEVAWIGGTPGDLGRLVAAGGEPAFVLDKTPSLMLYAVTQAAGASDSSLIEAFGTIVDRQGSTSIVAVPTVPAVVTDLTGAGFRVEKLTPYVPAGTPLLSTGTDAALPDVTELTETFPDLSAANIEQTIRDLASTGVAPGETGSRFFSLPGNAIAAEYLFLRFAAYGLDVWYEDYVASNGMLSLNVVAEIPGTDPGSGIYAAFAHYDTISDDVADNDTAPGALDNGTGLATLLENAHVLAGYRLHAAIRFVALDGEEVGLQGANAFGARHAELGTPFVGGINIDSVGTAYGQRVLYVNASDASAFVQDIMLDQYDAYGFELNIQPRQNPLIVADDTPLTDYGIPTILVASMLYGDPLINCTCDRIDGVDVDYTRATARLVLMTLAVLTSSPD